MRATSERRRAAGRGHRYEGAPGTPIVRERRDYEGTGPSFICDDCGARVSSERPKHRPGGGRPQPWSVCGPLEVADDHTALPTFTRARAARRYLVSLDQIASRFNVSRGSVEKLHLPAPVGRLLDEGASWRSLYYAPDVEAVVKTEKPRWFLRHPRPVGGAQ